MKTTSELHDEAMRLADEAFDASRQGNGDRAHRLFLKALKSERRAAEAFEHRLGMEPTRSVLYRSAATLAFHAGLPIESARLITAGLSGNPPLEIKQELDDLRKQIGTRRVSTNAPAQFESDDHMTVGLGKRSGTARQVARNAKKAFAAKAKVSPVKKATSRIKRVKASVSKPAGAKAKVSPVKKVVRTQRRRRANLGG